MSADRGVRASRRRLVLDLLYLALSAGFFALMLAYVRACARLGRAPVADDPGRGAPSSMDPRLRGDDGQ
jgi:hypothetical protein